MKEDVQENSRKISSKILGIFKESIKKDIQENSGKISWKMLG